MIRIAIVDDEKVIREQIKKLVEKKQIDCEIDTYGTGEDLLKADSVYDIIFLDIQMDGMNGIDTARALRQKADNTVLIFITGVKEYVFDAFDVAAFHYLIKPIEENKFWEVCDRAVLAVTKKKQNPSGQIFIKTRSQSITLDQSNVLYIESRAKKVEIHTKTNIVEAYAAISELEKQLVGSFYRCHRGYLVNMAFIAGYADYSSVTSKQAEKKATETTSANNGVVYEKSEPASTNKATYSINKMSDADRAALVKQLKADQASREQQLTSLVHKMMSGQAKTYGQATDMWKFLASGDYTVDAATKAQAQKDISEDGYWGVKQTSQRLFDFACALAGDDVDKMKEMQAAVEKGFKQATGAWGRELPSICKDTFDATNKLFDDYYASKEEQTE